MNYLTREQIFLIHSMVIDETGGTHGTRDSGPILSLEISPRQKVFGKELYPTIFLKAAVYAHNIINFHPFVDGNKRTGMSAASVFLENNGYEVVAREGEIGKFALQILSERRDIQSIAKWFKHNSRRVGKSK